MTGTENPEILLETRGIIKDFPGQRALDDVDFDIRRGEVHALVGANGAGKSTLLKIIAGVYRADAGEIYIDGIRQQINNPSEAQALGLGFIHQELNIVPHLSAAENMFLGLKYPKTALGLVNYPKLYRMAEEFPDALHLEFDVRTPAGELSTIQQWKTAINRALGQNARVIFMDEPTASLSYDEVKELFRSIAHLKESGRAIVYVSHRMEEIFEIADRVTVIKDARRVGTLPVKETDTGKLFQMMIGQEIKDSFPDKSQILDEVCLEVEGLSRHPLVRDFSFKLHRGEILGIAGLVGSGRTELARVIFGADRKDSGRVLINGKEVKVSSPADAIAHGLALVPEERRAQGVILPMSVKENISLANLTGLRRWPALSLISTAKEIKSTGQVAKEMEIKTTGLGQAVELLSGGNQQKVVLAKWLYTGAKIFIFDEPTRGIDIGSKMTIYQLITDLAQKGAGILLISSDLTEVVGLSHRILVINHGRLSCELKTEETDLSTVLRLCLAGNNKADQEAGAISN